ncbi:hypothetical protein H6H02_20430 [Coleofasciculus sp. FACHB-1120]|nr:hypothetical protein [Coleofasciculus sp. FACHB-1120]
MSSPHFSDAARLFKTARYQQKEVAIRFRSEQTSTSQPASLPSLGGLGKGGEGVEGVYRTDWQLSRKSDRIGEMECLYLHRNLHRNLHRRYPAPCWLCPTI